VRESDARVAHLEPLVARPVHGGVERAGLAVEIERRVWNRSSR
jgi:hypothetical protein